jgi:hypothetical protein
MVKIDNIKERRRNKKKPSFLFLFFLFEHFSACIHNKQKTHSERRREQLIKKEKK